MTPAERLGEFILKNDGKPDKDEYKAAVEEAKQAIAKREENEAALAEMRTLCRWCWYDGLRILAIDGTRGVPTVIAKLKSVLERMER